ncbi:hypothetical protein OAU40_01625 [Candidatus Pseudothioglobus singularis]|nr:hypothetical protein [Candidatus Pseudothioglobus singularis]
MSLVFGGYDVLLFTEANDWFFTTYLADAVLNNETNIYKIDQLNTPNALFIYTYLYMKDVLFFIEPYNLMKGILYVSFLIALITVYRLSAINSSYSILYPLLMSYVLVGGMINYYMGIVVILLFMYRLETVRKMPLWEALIFVLLAYCAHFLAMLPLMFYILFTFGIRKTILISIVPFLLLVSYKLTNINYHGIGGDYGFINHILSIRRVLLPSLVDQYYVDRIPQYYFSSSLNLVYMLSVLAVFWKYTKEKILKSDSYKLILYLIMIYFLVPASIAGSGLNMHERLIIPFVIFSLSAMKYKQDKISIIFTFIGILVAINLLFSQEKYDFDIYKDYGQYHCQLSEDGGKYGIKSVITNRAVIGRSAFLAESIINKKEVDSVVMPQGYRFFSASIVKWKDSNSNPMNMNCSF